MNVKALNLVLYTYTKCSRGGHDDVCSDEMEISPPLLIMCIVSVGLLIRMTFTFESVHGMEGISRFDELW